ncbi:glycoside hydrolase family 3 protein [Legionella tunisiensis]|uniref:glycoside hydrolase family 3 protein n=1 Tax=Legionella tunisiensis TaxID=1034944 RepID=UPI0002E397D5|nr:glycoside hydrolase family 3 N-terminal domain-containing protein [Legionella tunisiensis]
MKCFRILAVICSLLVTDLASADDVSLRDKIGQMLIIGFDGKTVDRNSPVIKAINEDNIGGVILFDYNQRTKNFDKNIASPTQVKELNHYLQRSNWRANEKRHRPQLPLLISVDYEGGEVNRLNKDYGFPETVAAELVGKMSLDEAGQLADTMGQTLASVGFNLNFAPDLDVNINPSNPIIAKKKRSFSANPIEVARYGKLFSHYFLQHGVQCAYKHFPGHGSANADSHLGFVDVTDTWQESELEPFKLLSGGDDSCGMIMTAHIVNRNLDKSGLPATLSHHVITELLREQLHFDGVIITDDMEMKAISANFALDDALTLAINAGVDMLIFGNQFSASAQDPKVVIDIIEAKVKAGEIKASRIDEAYRHITAFKRSIIRKTDR